MSSQQQHNSSLVVDGLDSPQGSYPQQQQLSGSQNQNVRMKAVFVDVREVGPKSQAIAR